MQVARLATGVFKRPRTYITNTDANRLTVKLGLKDIAALALSGGRHVKEAGVDIPVEHFGLIRGQVRARTRRSVNLLVKAVSKKLNFGMPVLGSSS